VKTRETATRHNTQNITEKRDTERHNTQNLTEKRDTERHNTECNGEERYREEKTTSAGSHSAWWTHKQLGAGSDTFQRSLAVCFNKTISFFRVREFRVQRENENKRNHGNSGHQALNCIT
jgi:hypothetical protein